MTRRAHRSTDAVAIARLTAAVGGIDSDDGPPLGDQPFSAAVAAFTWACRSVLICAMAAAFSAIACCW